MTRKERAETCALYNSWKNKQTHKNCSDTERVCVRQGRQRPTDGNGWSAIECTVVCAHSSNHCVCILPTYLRTSNPVLSPCPSPFFHSSTTITTSSSILLPYSKRVEKKYKKKGTGENAPSLPVTQWPSQLDQTGLWEPVGTHPLSVMFTHTHAQAVRVYLPVPTWFQSGFSSSYDRHWNETQLNTTTTSTHQSSPVELFVFSSWTFLLTRIRKLLI